MPKITEVTFINCALGVETSTQETPTGETVEITTIVIQDQQDMTQYKLPLAGEAKKTFVELLLGGVVIATPKMATKLREVKH